MAFADPGSIKVGATATPIMRVLTGTTEGFLVSENGSVSVTIKPGKAAGQRRSNTLQVRNKQIASVDPTLNGTVETMVSVSINRPKAGLTDADVITAVKNVFDFLTASTDTNLKKLVAGEN